ncbi:unnamed protein product [Peniophora sp. CBMAI 1063]|nr:unnamed protein product [Peniophora sp. CBMAI 1063]
MTKAKSLVRRQQEAAALKEVVLQRAMVIYVEELAKPNGDGSRECCQRATDEFIRSMGVEVKLNHATLINRLKGGLSIAEAHTKAKLIKPHVARKIIEHVKELALRGWPINFQRLRDIIDTFLRSTLGDEFKGVGHNHVYRFVEEHHTELKAYWTRSLESNRGQAVNPATNKAWFDLLIETAERLNIAPECTAGTDEAGFNSALIQRAKAIGVTGRKTLYQRNDGPRENITVIATIFADGTSLAPTVIFKGDGFQVQWAENNSMKATIGHSHKGWTDGEIGVDWIKDFDEKTRERAAGRPRLLLVDGHNSHYTEAFLAYARAHDIHVLCYPAHTTHVYQGLDVVVFAKLKTYWNEAKVAMKVRVTKRNFIECLAVAWERAMTPANIKAAFRKTGVYPRDPSVIKDADLAPSRATTTKAAFTVEPPEPVRILTSFFRDVLRRQELATELPQQPSGEQPTDGDVDMDSSADTAAATESARLMKAQLLHSSVGWLVDGAPISSVHQLPAFALSPLLALPIEPLAPFTPQTENESRLHAALLQWMSIAHIQAEERENERITLVLQSDYVDRVRSQLIDKENKKTSTRQKLVGDGLPRLLTDDAFFARVQEHEKRMAEDAAGKESRKLGAEGYKAAKVEWEYQSRKRREQNDAIKAEYAGKLAEWKTQCEQRKRDGDRSRASAIPKPLRGPLVAAIPKPKLKDFAPKAGEDQVNDDVDSDEEMEEAGGEGGDDDEGSDEE